MASRKAQKATIMRANKSKRASGLGEKRADYVPVFRSYLGSKLSSEIGDPESSDEVEESSIVGCTASKMIQD